MHTPGDDEVAILWRLGRVVLVMGCVVAAIVLAVSNSGIHLPWQGDNSKTTPAADQTALAAQQSAADKRWASSACTSVLDWKQEINRDETSVDLGFGPVARVKDAIGATSNMLDALDKLGLPPGAQGARARADLTQLRSDLESQLRDIEGTASSVAGGNLLAIGKLVRELENEKALGPQIAAELRGVVSVDLGLSLVETRACRELVGSPV